MDMTIGIADAKARLSELVERAAAGTTITISRNGQPLVEMRAVRQIPVAETVARIRALRARIARRNAGKPPWPPKGVRLRRLAHEGHHR